MTHKSTSSARWGILALLLVALGAALWLLVLRPSERVSGVQPDARAPAEVALDTTPLAEVAADPGAAAARAPVAVALGLKTAARPAKDTDAQNPDEEDPEAGDWIDVEVVYATDGRPAPEAELFVLELTAGSSISLAAAVARGDSVDELLRSMGKPLPLDESARARVPVADRSTTAVAALAEGHLGLLEEFEGSGPHTLELDPIHIYEARVVDADGTPLPGILVAFRVIQGDDRTDTFTSLSDANGNVRLGVPGSMLASMAVEGPLQVQMALAAKGLFLEAVEVLLGMEPTPGVPLEIRLPPHGWLQLSRGQGSAASGRLLTTVRLEGAEPTWGTQAHRELETVVDKEPVRVGPLQLGLRLDVEAMGAGSMVHWSATGPGPNAAGETASLVLTPDGVWTLRGRAVDEEGTPLSRAALRVGVQLDAVSPDPNLADFGQGLRVRCDSDGRFELELPGNLSRPAMVHFAVRRRGVDRQAHVALAPGGGEGWDMGELRMRPPQLGAEGQAVDPEGVPIAGANVTLLQDRSVEAKGVQLFHVDSVQTDRSGRFRFSLPAEPGRLIVRVQARHFLPGEREAAPGEDVGAIQLARASGLRGKVHFDSNVSAREFAAVAVMDGRERARTPLKSDGTFVIEGLPPGTMSVELDHARWLGERFGSAGTVDVAPGGAEATLAPLDARGALQVTRVQVLCENGKPVAFVLAKIPAPASNGSASTGGSDGKPARLRSREVPSADVDSEGAYSFWHLVGSHTGSIFTHGYSPREVQFEGGLQVVQLAPLNDLTLVVRIPADFPNDVELEVGLEQGNSARFANLSKPSVQLRLPEMEAGEHQLTFAVAREGAMVPVVLPAEEGRIRVAEFPTAQTIEVDLPAAVLARALELANGG